MNSRIPKVSVIVVNYNGISVIKDCLQSIIAQTFKDFETIVVDNCSTDESIKLIRFMFPSVTLIELKKNIGFAGGCNIGIKNSRGQYIALINNDAIAEPLWLQQLVNAADRHPDVGICASKLIAFGTNVIDSVGDGYATWLKGFKRGEGEDKERYDQMEYIFGACAGAALYRRNMLEEVGFFDEDFFLIHEDTDLNFRAQLAGWKVMYVPSAVVYHKVRSTIGHMSDAAVYYTLRNSEFVRIKNIPLLLFIKCLPEFILGIISEFLYFVVRHKKLKLYLKAKIDVIKFFPKMLRKRRDIMENVKKVDNRYIHSVMASIWDKEFFIMKIKKFLCG